MRERWRPVVGYEGWYDVSDLGHVRRMKSGHSTWIGRILKGTLNNCGYIQVSLCKDGGQRVRRIHQLVAAAFIGPCLDGKEVNHKDGVKPNNVATNLEYVTPSENTLHAVRNGLFAAARGEANGIAVLTEEKVHEVRRRLLAKESQKSIARDLDVDPSTISYVATGGTWSWLKEEE